MSLPVELVSEICKTAFQQDIQDSNELAYKNQKTLTVHPIWIRRGYQRCSPLRLASPIFDALLTPILYQSLDFSVKRMHQNDPEAGLAQLETLADEAPIKIRHAIRGVSIYVELSMPTSHTRRLFQAASKLLETLDNLEELLILFETSEPTYEARLWIDADTLKPLVNALENKTKLRTLTLQNARGTNRLLFCQPVRLAGGLELFKAVPRLKNLALAGVSPTTDHFNMDWKMQASLKSLMPSLERVDFNFPLGLGIAYTQQADLHNVGSVGASTWKLPWSLSCQDSPNLTHLCLVDADVSLATLQRFLWASHETLQHLHIIALFFVEESDISIQAPPLPHLQKIWVRLLNEQPRQSAKLLRWLLLSPDLEAICLNMSSGPYDAALELLLQALPTRWPLLRELCWSLHPDRGVSQALADLVHRRRLAFHSEGRHNAACFKAVNTVIDRRPQVGCQHPYVSYSY